MNIFIFFPVSYKTAFRGWKWREPSASCVCCGQRDKDFLQQRNCRVLGSLGSEVKDSIFCQRSESQQKGNLWQQQEEQSKGFSYHSCCTGAEHKPQKAPDSDGKVESKLSSLPPLPWQPTPESHLTQKTGNLAIKEYNLHLGIFIYLSHVLNDTHSEVRRPTLINCVCWRLILIRLCTVLSFYVYIQIPTQVCFMEHI